MKKLRPESYAELLETFSLDVPGGYNFAFDFLDVEAAKEPTRPAMAHIDPEGRRRDFDLAFFSRESAKAANASGSSAWKKATGSW